MANTTDLLIVTKDSCIIEEINSKTGLKFELMTDASKAGGTHCSIFEAYGYSSRCLTVDVIQHLIEVFNKLEYCDEDHTCLHINCDNNESMSGIYKIGSNKPI